MQAVLKIHTLFLVFFATKKYNLVFDTFKKKKALQPLKTRACSALWSVHEI